MTDPRVQVQESEPSYAGRPTGRCVCCNAGVVVPGPGVPPFITHGPDRLSGEPCPRRDWPVLDAIADDA